MNIKKIVLKVFSANFLQLLSGIIVGFVVPSILDIPSYANLKTYTLYLSYIGLFHFGFIDGIYLKYGGKSIKSLNKSELFAEHNFILKLEIFVSLILIIIGIVLKNCILLLFSFSLLPYVVSSFFKYLYQSTGEFSKYTKIVYLYSLSYLVINILLALVFRNSNYIFYCVAAIFSNFLSAVYFEIKFISDNCKTKPNYNRNNLLIILKTGFTLMIGNLIVVFILGIDKWFVKLFLSVNDFAYYSFAVSMLNIINTLVSAVSITFYNYLFKNQEVEKIDKMKNLLFILGGFASSVFFILSIIVRMFLSKYIPSLYVISITFAIFPYLIVITSLINNLYKVNKKEKEYLSISVIVLILSIILNAISILIYKDNNSIAIATLITMAFWLIYSSNKVDNFNLYFYDYLYLFFTTISYLLISHFLNSVIGLILYLLVVIICSVLLYKDTILYVMGKERKK